MGVFVQPLCQSRTSVAIGAQIIALTNRSAILFHASIRAQAGAPGCRVPLPEKENPVRSAVAAPIENALAVAAKAAERHAQREGDEAAGSGDRTRAVGGRTPSGRSTAR